MILNMILQKICYIKNKNKNHSLRNDILFLHNGHVTLYEIHYLQHSA